MDRVNKLIERLISHIVGEKLVLKWARYITDPSKSPADDLSKIPLSSDGGLVSGPVPHLPVSSGLCQ